MKRNPGKHHRKSMRLKDYDYSAAGAYFVTICSHNRDCIFGDIVNGKMYLSQFGDILESEWLQSREIRKEVELDIYQVMPNHFHAIVFIADLPENRIHRGETDAVGANGRSPLPDSSRPRMRPKSLSSLMAGFKSAVMLRINQIRKTPGVPVWQRNYWDRIIRNEKELFKIRQYIINNPLKWELELDHDNPANWKSNR